MSFFFKYYIIISSLSLEFCTQINLKKLKINIFSCLILTFSMLRISNYSKMLKLLTTLLSLGLLAVANAQIDPTFCSFTPIGKYLLIAYTSLKHL